MFKLLASSALCLVVLSGAERAEITDTKQLLAEIAKGGYVLYLRHALTESDYADQLTADVDNCGTQRVLSEAGWAQAKAIGAAVKAAAISVGEVLSSQYYRAWQTADLAFGSYTKVSSLNFEKAESYTDQQTATMRANVMPLLLAPIDAGTNRVIVGHDDPLDAAIGLYPEPQGVMVVLRQDSKGGVEIMGQIAPDDWPGM